MLESKNRLSRWFGERKAVRLMLLAALLALAVIHSRELLGGLLLVVHAAKPLLVGGAVAYILEIYVSRLNRVLFPNTKKVWLARGRRSLAIALSFIILVSFLVLVIYVVLPGLAEAVTVLARELPRYFQDAKNWALETFKDVPAIVEYIEPIQLDWKKISDRVIQFATGGTGSGVLISSTVTVVSTVTGEIAEFFISLIFAVFLLAGKAKLHRQFVRLARALLPERKRNLLHLILSTGHRCFSGFTVGQMLFGLISGVSTWFFMFIFRMPYAIMVGVICGTFILIPIIGGYIGAAVGVFLVFTASPSMAVWFLLMIILLQTLEGNLIYPRLLGSSVGMPALWVLAAVSLGGGLGGIIGMLISVPLGATAYALLKKWVEKKEAESAQPTQPVPV